MTEGDLATVIWRACADAGHPIGVPASRHAAAQALAVLGQPPALQRVPPLERAFLEDIHPRAWHNAGVLATELRRYAARLDARAHAAMMADAHKGCAEWFHTEREAAAA